VYIRAALGVLGKSLTSTELVLCKIIGRRIGNGFFGGWVRSVQMNGVNINLTLREERISSLFEAFIEPIPTFIVLSHLCPVPVML